LVSTLRYFIALSSQLMLDVDETETVNSISTTLATASISLLYLSVYNSAVILVLSSRFLSFLLVSSRFLSFLLVSRRFSSFLLVYSRLLSFPLVPSRSLFPSRSLVLFPSFSFPLTNHHFSISRFSPNLNY
jgi:hypothetical protein